MLPPALSSISVLFRCSSLGGQTRKGKSQRQPARSPTAEGGGLPGLAGALVPILSSQAYRERKGFVSFSFFFPGRGLGFSASSNMAGILLAKDTGSPAAQGAG